MDKDPPSQTPPHQGQGQATVQGAADGSGEPGLSGQEIGYYFALFNEIGIISQLSRAVMEEELPHGLLVSHFSVLNHLIRVKDGQTPLKLASAFQTPKTTMTHTLMGLEKHGLIEMRPNPKDGRSKCVWLSDAGRALRDETIQKLGGRFQDLAAAFPTSKIGDLVPRLAEIRMYMDAARDED